MSKVVHAATPPAELSTQQLVIDSEGRVVLPQPILALLGVKPGATLSYLLADGVLMLLPKGIDISALVAQASAAPIAADPWYFDHDGMEKNLAEIRAQVVREMYGAEYMDELERKYGHLVGTALATEDSSAEHE